MLKFENTDVFNFENAIHGMRNPLSSWNKSDSHYDDMGFYEIGETDLKLAQQLIRAGNEHRKFMRQIFVSVDITAPRYWWIEADTYKVGTVSNSCSTMHTIHKKPFINEDFSCEHLDTISLRCLEDTITTLNDLRNCYLSSQDKEYWYQIIQMLPQSYLQKRTWTCSYENLLTICSAGQRRNHKLDEWKVDFMDWARSLPYAQELIFIDEVYG